MIMGMCDCCTIDHTGNLEDSRKEKNMNTVDKFVNEISQNLANAIVEATKYKVSYEEAQAQLEQAQAQLARVNAVLDADQALKELFDEVAENLEKED